jgi:hypothetical protein
MSVCVFGLVLDANPRQPLWLRGGGEADIKASKEKEGEAATVPTAASSR